MVTKFNANFIYSQIESDVIVIGFADDEFNTKDYILLQKTISSSEQDKQSGFDRVHITYKNQLHSTYAGIIKIILNVECCEISLDSNTADILGTDKTIEILFPTGIIFGEVEKHLEQMFKGEVGVFINKI